MPVNAAWLAAIEALTAVSTSLLREELTFVIRQAARSGLAAFRIRVYRTGESGVEFFL